MVLVVLRLTSRLAMLQSPHMMDIKSIELGIREKILPIIEISDYSKLEFKSVIKFSINFINMHQLYTNDLIFGPGTSNLFKTVK